MATIARTIAVKTNDGEQLFPVKELDFYNLVCDLEGQGVDVMTLTSGGLDRSKLFTTVRALFAVMTGLPFEEAGKLIGQHLANGGSLEDVFGVFVEAMNDAGFGKTPKTPQDHKKAQSKRGGKQAK